MTRIRTLRRAAGFTLDLTDDLQPRIPAGQFSIGATQAIEGIDTGGYLPGQTRYFEVRAPQFQLAPATVHAVNPFPDSVGALDRTLAHITLRGRTLPWARTLDPDDILDTGPALARPPWLALVVFAAGELPGDPEATGQTETMTVEDLLWPSTPDPSVVRPRISRHQVVGDPSRPVETIVVPGGVFAEVCPRQDELRYLAHVRTVHADALLRGEDPIPGEFATLFASRLPNTAGGRHVAHLVSLEGCLDALDTAGSDGGAGDVRLASLHHWSFDALPSGAVGFAERVHDLLFDDDHGAAARDLLLRMPHAQPEPGSDDATRRAAERLDQGWVPLPYQVASGEETFAWYRGPFTARPARPPAGLSEDAWAAAEGLLVYDEHRGMFDTTWASAWSVGRAIALADDDFAARLNAWRTRVRHRGAALAQRLAAASAHEDIHNADAAALAVWSTPRPRLRALTELAESGSAETVIRALSEVVPGERRAAGGGAPPTQTATPPRRKSVRRVLNDLLGETAMATTTAFGSMLRETMAEDSLPLDQWLRRLRLLHPVPFDHLVPFEAMLPPESVRLFHVDTVWLRAVQAGALSAGENSVTDEALAALAAPWRQASQDPDETWPAAGLLMRSALTRECPDLVIQGWHGREPARLLRRDVLDGDILLVLFDRVPDTLELSEPPEGLSFGIDPHPEAGVPVVNLRALGPGDTGKTLTGVYFPEDPGAAGLTPYLRPGATGRRVLDLHPHDNTRLLGALRDRLVAAGQLAGGDELGPAAFALQLVNIPFRQFIDPVSISGEV
ncbi:hypothetical protein [Amycolatopsis panacis]|uniref:Uncharacterized protein n=1 Tax=Amycolatopsis panacis TaxID=2340917 RepID=A0A419I260_9PSEU|nr:hypothetical protein [Amycolatopsis panacis]RJQ83880.1 hypothetical protein D5S19_18925 [Amycolatopsis panacis]